MFSLTIAQKSSFGIFHYSYRISPNMVAHVGGLADSELRGFVIIKTKTK